MFGKQDQLEVKKEAQRFLLEIDLFGDLQIDKGFRFANAIHFR